MSPICPAFHPWLYYPLPIADRAVSRRRRPHLQTDRRIPSHFQLLGFSLPTSYSDQLVPLSNYSPIYILIIIPLTAPRSLHSPFTTLYPSPFSSFRMLIPLTPDRDGGTLNLGYFFISSVSLTPIPPRPRPCPVEGVVLPQRPRIATKARRGRHRCRKKEVTG